MFRCRHCEFLQKELERARTDARTDLAVARANYKEELERLTGLLDEERRKNDRLQL